MKQSFAAMSSQASSNAGSFVMSELGGNCKDMTSLAPHHKLDNQSSFEKLFVFDQKKLNDEDSIRIDRLHS